MQPKICRVLWTLEGDFAALDLKLAGVWWVHACCDLHQGGLACPVLAHDGMHFARHDVKRHVVQCLDAGKRLRDAG